MSLYNLMHGRNPLSHLLLAMLDLDEGSVGRFRDCYLMREDDEAKTLRVCIYTRNGGGNRDDYAGTTEALQAHPDYVRDYDEEHDCTYASYIFRVPEKLQQTAEMLAGLGGEHTETPEQRFNAMLEKLKSGDASDPAIARVMEAGKQIFEGIAKASADGVTVVKV